MSFRSMRGRGVVAIVVAALFAARSARAHSRVPMLRSEHASLNGRCVLVVDQSADVLSVFRAGQPASPIWSFRRPVQFETYLVSDGCAVVVVLADDLLLESELTSVRAIEFWSARGCFRQYSVAELTPRPARVEEAARDWRERPEPRHDGFDLQTSDERRYRFRYADGAITWRRRPDVRLIAVAVVLGTLIAVPWLALAWRSVRRARREVAT